MHCRERVATALVVKAEAKPKTSLRWCRRRVQVDIGAYHRSKQRRGAVRYLELETIRPHRHLNPQLVAWQLLEKQRREIDCSRQGQADPEFLNGSKLPSQKCRCFSPKGGGSAPHIAPSCGVPQLAPHSGLSHLCHLGVVRAPKLTFALAHLGLAHSDRDFQPLAGAENHLRTLPCNTIKTSIDDPSITGHRNPRPIHSFEDTLYSPHRSTRAGWLMK